MIISFNFGNVSPEELQRLAGHVMPIFAGLSEAGHRVERYAFGLKPAPVVNVVIDRFDTPAAVDSLLQVKARSGDGVLLGALRLDNVDDGEADDRGLARQQNFARLRSALDFVWSVFKPDRDESVHVPYGFSVASQAGPEIAAPGERDLDVMLYGRGTERRRGVVDSLRRRGLSCFWVDCLDMPHYVIADLLSRSKIYLNICAEAGGHGASSAMIGHALHRGAVVVSERSDRVPRHELGPYTVPAAWETLEELCVSLIGSQMHARLGPAAVARFRAETSMRDTMAAALRLPVFERFARP